ncbi:MAG: 1-phosphofructokinase family hexose kinase [Saccharofermentanales bacterium]
MRYNIRVISDPDHEADASFFKPDYASDGGRPMPQTIVVCLSPAIDRNYKLFSMTPGQMHRSGNPVINAGGKGVNVSRVLSLLGADVKLTGFFAGASGRFILDDLISHGVSAEPVFIPGETRSSINILETDSGLETEILESGPIADESDFLRLQSVLTDLLRADGPDTCVVFSGGITAGLPPDAYETLIGIANRYHARSILDTSSEALAYGIRACPYFIKPNLREFSSITEYTGHIQDIVTVSDLAVIRDSALSLGMPVVAVTLSSKGAVVNTPEALFYAHPLPVIPVNTIGSGDSFTAGFTYATALGGSIHSALSLAVACASSNALFEKVGIIDPEQVGILRGQVIIDEYRQDESKDINFKLLEKS